MTFAIYILMGVALVNEVRRGILPKKTTVAIHFTKDSIFSVLKRHLTSCTLLILVLKVGVSKQILKED